MVVLTAVQVDAEVKPPDKFPTEADTLQVIDKVTLVIDLYLWQNFMPGPEETGPPFYVSLQLTVKNNGSKRLVGFKAAELTLYPENSKKPFHTFHLTSDDPQAPVEVKPGQEEYFTYTNNRKQFFSPKIEKEARFYSRIKLIWGGKERIISSPLVGVEFTY
jgi:hypothetical protein